MAHLHSIYDTDKHFTIDPITRNITIDSPKLSIMQYDHNSERFTFEIPRYIEGHDMSLSDTVRIDYINIGSTSTERTAAAYEADDVQISPDSDDVVIFSWLISRNCTKFSGSLNFAIRFNCIVDGELEYSWGTGIYSGIKVSNGLDNSDVIVEDYVDVLEQWKKELYSITSDLESKVENISDSNSVHYTEDVDKTDEEKAQARINIGAQETIEDLETIRAGALSGSNSIQKDEVDGLTITTSETSIYDIGSDAKLITPAGVQALINRVCPVPISITPNSNYNVTERFFSKDVQYDVGDKCLYTKISNGEFYTHIYECVTAHNGTWVDSDFSDLGTAFSAPSDINMLDFLPSINMGTLKARIDNMMLIQNGAMTANGTKNTVSLQYISSKGITGLSIMFNSESGNIVGLIASAVGVSNT